MQFSDLKSSGNWLISTTSISHRIRYLDLTRSREYSNDIQSIPYSSRFTRVGVEAGIGPGGGASLLPRRITSGAEDRRETGFVAGAGAEPIPDEFDRALVDMATGEGATTVPVPAVGVCEVSWIPGRRPASGAFVESVEGGSKYSAVECCDVL